MLYDGSFSTLITIIPSLCAVVQGFLVTQEQLSGDGEVIDWFVNHDNENFFGSFLGLFYFGEVIGALSSFILSDGFGRKNGLLILSTMSALFILWSMIATSDENILIARFMLGWGVGE